MSGSGNLRILVVTSTFPRWKDDSEPAFVFELCRRLHRLGAVIDVIAPHAPGANTVEMMDGLNIYRYRYCPESLEILAYQGGILANLRGHWFRHFIVPFFLLFQAVAVWRRLATEKYDLMHAHWIIPQGFICILTNLLFRRRYRIPLVCTIHGSDLYALRGWFFNTIRRFLMTRITHICVVSRAMRQICLGELTQPEHISVLPMGVDLKKTFTPLVEVARKEKRLLFVGRLVEKKGIAFLIEALAFIKTTIPDIELVLTGDGPDLHAITQKIKLLGLEQNVKLTGSLVNTELPQVYSSAAIFVMPSVQEGLGLVMVEAMGCGCAVIASDLPATHDIIINEQNGLLTKPGDVADLAEKIMRLLKDKPLRERLAAQGRVDAGRFDWDETAVQYYKLFMKLARRK